MRPPIRKCKCRTGGKGVKTKIDGFKRDPRYILGIVTGIVVVVACGLVVHADDVPSLERPVFRFVNAFPDLIYRPIWVVMQLGNLLAIPVFVLGALAFRRWRLAPGLLLAGIGKLYLARVIKSTFERHRPATIMDDVVRREDFGGGLAFVSGHAIVVVAIATLVAPYLSRRWRIAIWSAAALVCFGRVYVGAHLPLDVIGGAAVGWAMGSLLNLALGVPAREMTNERAPSLGFSKKAGAHS